MLRLKNKKFVPAISLIELLVVIVIVGILAAAVGPNLGGWNCRQDLRNDFENINGFMQTLRLEAVNRNKTMKAVLKSGRILMAFEGNTPNANQNCNGSRFTWLGHPKTKDIIDYHIKSKITFQRTFGCFKADGSATANSYTLSRQCGGKTYLYRSQIFGATGFISKEQYNSSKAIWEDL